MNSLLFRKVGCAVAAMSVAVAVCSCSSPVATDEAQGWWKGDRVQGSPRILIDLSQQVVKYYKGGQMVGAAPISSGREGCGTVRGTYRIIEKDEDHRSSIYGSFVDAHGRIVEEEVDVRRDSPPPGTRYLGASMRCFMRIKGGIGMHEGHLPGFAASHGCIRLPSRMAAIFFHATPLGTPVEIVGCAPEGSLTTLLPVPHKLNREDIVIAPKVEEDKRAKAQVALSEPPVAEQTKQVAAAPAVPKKGPIWGGWFAGRDEKPQSVEPVKVMKPVSEPAAKPAPAVAAAPQQVNDQPLASLEPKTARSAWGWAKKSTAPEPSKAPKKRNARGQTYFLPGYD
ncbi:MAG: hypothetical protein RIS79_4063 [Verrucomicrobiota bacterium]